MTDKFKISRIISACAVLVENNQDIHGDINRMVLGRGAYLIQNIWQATFPKLTRKCDINDFWRRVRKTVSLGDDVFELIVVWDQTVNPPGCEYGENVRIQITTAFESSVHHRMDITAKKD